MGFNSGFKGLKENCRNTPSLHLLIFAH